MLPGLRRHYFLDNHIKRKEAEDCKKQQAGYFKKKINLEATQLMILVPDRAKRLSCTWERKTGGLQSSIFSCIADL